MFLLYIKVIIYVYSLYSQLLYDLLQFIFSRAITFNTAILFRKELTILMKDNSITYTPAEEVYHIHHTCLYNSFVNEI